ncbi:MAG: hypothetical protein ACRDZT_09735, partial [Acidimicrobiales bacterium]
GNCTTTPCNGSIQGNFADNSFSMKGATGGEAIDLKADYTGNTLTYTVYGNSGYVTKPSGAMKETCAAGASMSVSQFRNDIDIHS